MSGDGLNYKLIWPQSYLLKNISSWPNNCYDRPRNVSLMWRLVMETRRRWDYAASDLDVEVKGLSFGTKVTFRGLNFASLIVWCSLLGDDIFLILTFQSNYQISHQELWYNLSPQLSVPCLVLTNDQWGAGSAGMSECRLWPPDGAGLGLDRIEWCCSTSAAVGQRSQVTFQSITSCVTVSCQHRSNHAPIASSGQYSSFWCLRRRQRFLSKILYDVTIYTRNKFFSCSYLTPSVNHIAMLMQSGFCH